MITQEKLLIYKKYYGFEDGLVRFGKTAEMGIMGDGFGQIDSFIQDIFIVKKGLASKEYSERLEKNLLLHCESDSIISELKAMAAAI